ncbi:MAG: M15 family metallopeptidase [Chloroflexota bacterium]
MSQPPALRELPAPRAASAPRRGTDVELIVLHRDQRPAAEALEAYAAPQSRRSPHYHIDATGATTQLVPESRAARFSGLATWRRRRRNIDRAGVAIALEGAAGEPFTPQQLAALERLAGEIAARFGLSGDAVVAWEPPEPGQKSGTLTRVYLPLFLPRAPRRPPLLGEAREKSEPPLLGVEQDAAAGERLWLALQEEAFKLRGGIGFQPAWAFHLHAANQSLGAPLAPSSPEPRWISVGGKRYGYQPFARDTIFNEGRNWTAVQSLSQIAGGSMPAAGTLGFLLLQRSYDDALAAGPQPPTGKTGFKPDQAMAQFALKERLGPALSGNYTINVAGATYAVQVFAGDTLYTPIAPPGQTTNWGVVKRLSQEPPGALRTALWAETYKVCGGTYDPASPFQQAAEREKLGAPLSGLLRVSVDGQTYEAQVFALDTLYAPPGGEPRRASALAKPQVVQSWKPAPAAPSASSAPPTSGATLASTSAGAPQRTPAWPPAPGFRFLSTAERERLFGKFAYRVNPNRTVTITDGWEAANIVDVPTPQLARLGVRSVKFHVRARAQLEGLLNAWQEAGLIDRILSWDGTYNPRMMRTVDQLSSHAWGTAFDINARQNGQGVQPPLVGQPACVRELVPLANQFGFFWGGHFTGAFVDGMHFEVAVLL